MLVMRPRSMQAAPPTIVIIGAGFSGTVTAVHLLGRLGAGGRIVIVNRSGVLARGVAYGTTSDQHVLNVPAGRMSALEDDPESFVRFVRLGGLTADGGTFVSRHLYGAYLEALLEEAAARTPEVVLDRRIAEVVSIDPVEGGTHAWVTLSDGARLRADRVVLAIGNYPPQDPLVSDPGFCGRSRRYVRDPWRPDAFADADLRQPVLVIGTGLTMVDIVLQLQGLGASGGFTAVSRHGLLPLPHRSPSHLPENTEVPPELLEGPATTRAYVRAVRRYARAATARGDDWRDVIAALRPVTPRLWQALSVPERTRFMRHARPYWDVHRHRIAPRLHSAFSNLRERGEVTILAGRILELHDASDHVRVRFRPRGSRETRDVTVGMVVNCSGPAGDTRRLADRLFERLRTQGLVVPDALGAGIEASSTGALIGRDGCASPVLFYVGPFLRARDWEATAVPELRRYARQLADHLVDSLPSVAPAPRDALPDIV